MGCQVDELITALSLDLVHTNRSSELASFAIIVTMNAFHQKDLYGHLFQTLDLSNVSYYCISNKCIFIDRDKKTLEAVRQ